MITFMILIFTIGILFIICCTFSLKDILEFIEVIKYMINKNRKCKHKCTHIPENVISGGYNMPQGFIEEYDVVCENCKETIGHWAYGSFDIDYMIKFQLKGFKKIKAIWNHIIKPKIRRFLHGKR